MSTRIDHFQDGNEETRRKLNQIVDVVNAVLNMRGDKNIRVRVDPHAGITATFIGNQIIPYTRPVQAIPGAGTDLIFPVTVTVSLIVDPGSPTTNADFLYKVKNAITNEVLADNQTALLARPANVRMVGGTKGVAYYVGSPSPGSSFADANLRLYVLDEQRAIRTCAT